MANETNTNKKASENILNTTGSSGSILDQIMGFNKADSFYEYFYNAFLTTANCVPLNSLWLIFIDSVPIDAMNYHVQNHENNWDIAKSIEKSSKEASRPKGIIIAQAIKEVGETITTSKEGFNNSGYLKGTIAQQREGHSTLKVSFLETNLSFVDYTLRPWAIAIGQEGLKNPLLKTNMTVWHLSKMGARRNFAKRKVFKYWGCAPVMIGEQEYNYSDGDVVIQREVDFAFNYYTMEDADEALLKLLDYNDADSALLKWLEDMANRRIEDLQRIFGANTPMQYIQNLIDKAKAFSKNVIEETGKGIVTNVAGGIQDRINDTITSIEGRITKASNDLVKSTSLVADTSEQVTPSVEVNNEISKAIGTIKAERLKKEKEKEEDNTINLSEKSLNYKSVIINNDDSTNFVTDKDVIFPAEGGIIIKRVNNDKANADALLKNPVNYIQKSIEQSDTPLFGGLFNEKYIKEIKPKETDVSINSIVTFKQKTIEKNDTPIFNGMEPFENRNVINENDTPLYDGINSPDYKNLISPKGADETLGDLTENMEYIEVDIEEDDTPKFK